MLGGKPVPVLAEEAQGFKITPAQLEAAVTAKTKAVMLNNPQTRPVCSTPDLSSKPWPKSASGMTSTLSRTRYTTNSSTTG